MVEDHYLMGVKKESVEDRCQVCLSLNLLIALSRYKTLKSSPNPSYGSNDIERPKLE